MIKLKKIVNKVKTFQRKEEEETLCEFTINPLPNHNILVLLQATIFDKWLLVFFFKNKLMTTHRERLVT
jgi:hypothetical protein